SARLTRIARVLVPGRVGEDGEACWQPFDRFERFLKLLASLGHISAMERSSDGQAPAGYPTPRERLRRSFDLLGRPRQNGLPWRVLVGEDQIEAVLAKGIFDRLHRRLHGQHGPAVACPGGHEPASLERQAYGHRDRRP